MERQLLKKHFDSQNPPINHNFAKNNTIYNQKVINGNNSKSIWND